MKEPIFTGSAVAIVTPFTETGVDFDKLEELIEFHIANQTIVLLFAEQPANLQLCRTKNISL